MQQQARLVGLSGHTKRQHLQEDLVGVDDWVVPWIDMMDRFQDGFGPLSAASYLNDRRYGQNFPMWQNEQQLALMRGPARVLLAINAYAIGLLSGITSYVIGTGMTIRILQKTDADKAVAQIAQKVWDEYALRMQWPELEQELFWRTREDGEYFLRHFFDESTGLTESRTVEPEQCMMPTQDIVGKADIEHYSFGIRTRPRDVQTPEAYWFRYLDGSGDGEEVPVSEVVHCKVNVKRSIKRGVTDFWGDTYRSLTAASKLRRNLEEGAAVQAAIAFIRQHEMALQPTVQAFVDGQADFQRVNPVTGNLQDVRKYDAGTVLDIDKGRSYIEPPGASNSPGHIEVLCACLRGASARWNAPAWLGTSDSTDTVFASALTAESPFVRRIETEQVFYAARERMTVVAVLKNAMRSGQPYQLPSDLFSRIEIKVEATSPETRNSLEETQENQIRVQGGWKSRQTVMQEEGLDVEQEQKNIVAWQDEMGPDVPPLGMPGDEQPKDRRPVMRRRSGNRQGQEQGRSQRQSRYLTPWTFRQRIGSSWRG